MTIYGRKCTPRALPLARITSGTTSVGRSAKTSTLDPRTATCMGGGGSKAAPMSGLRCRQGWSLPNAPTWRQSTSASARTARSTTEIIRGPAARGPHPGARKPAARRLRGDAPRRVAIRAWAGGGSHLRTGRLLGLALGLAHTLQGHARYRKASFRAADSLKQGRNRVATSLDVHLHRDLLDAVMRCDGGHSDKVGLVDRAAHQGHAL